MSEKLEVIITAVDNASNVLKGIGGVAQGVLTVGLAAAGAAAGLLATGLGLAIKEAMEAETVQAQLAAVLKSTGGAAGVTAEMANELAEGLSEVTRFSDDAILSAENLLLTFTGIGKDVFPDVTAMALDMSTAMGQDLKSSAIQLGKALNNPLEGLTALTRVGVAFTDEQKEMIEKMVEAGDVAGAQAVIMAELKKEFGGSAQAAGKTFAGQLDILKNSLLNVAEGVGMKLLPQMQAFVEDVIMPAVPQIQAFVGALVDGLLTYIPIIVGHIQSFTAEMVNFFQTVVAPFVTEHGEALKTVLTAIVAGFAAFAIITTVVGWVTGLIAAVSAAGAAISAAGGIIGAIVALLGGPVTIVIGAVAIAVGVFAAAWKNNWGGIRDTLTSLWNNSIKPAIQDLWTWLEVTVPAAIQTLKGYWEDTLLPAINRVWTWMKTYLFPFFEALADLLSAVVGKAIEGLTELWEKKLLPAITKVHDWFDTKVKPVLEEIARIINKVIGPAIAWLKDSLIDPMNGKLEALQTWLEKVTNWFRKLAEAIRGVPDYDGPNPRATLPDGSVLTPEGVSVTPTGGAAYGFVGASAGVVNNWNLTINEAGRGVDPVMAFGLMKALAS